MRSTCGTSSRRSQALSRPPRRLARPPARMPSVTSPRAIIGTPLNAWSLRALDAADQALLLGDLALGQHVLLVLVRVLAFPEQEADRRADQLEALAEEVLELALVGVRQRLQPRAMHDEGRRTFRARVGETH